MNDFRIDFNCLIVFNYFDSFSVIQVYMCIMCIAGLTLVMFAALFLITIWATRLQA